MRGIDPFYVQEDSYSRFGNATTQVPRFDANRNPYGYPAQQARPHPPRYSDIAGAGPEIERTWYDPRGWSLRKKLIVAACGIVVIVAVIVGAVEGVKANAYPNYTALNYTLIDTFSGSSFFDNFDYYTATDPTDGFVQYASLLWYRYVCQC